MNMISLLVSKSSYSKSEKPNDYLAMAGKSLNAIHMIWCSSFVRDKQKKNILKGLPTKAGICSRLFMWIISF